MPSMGTQQATGSAARNSQRKQEEIRVKAPVFGLKPESHEEERTDPLLFAWQGPRCHFWVNQTNICFEEKGKLRRVETIKVSILQNLDTRVSRLTMRPGLGASSTCANFMFRLKGGDPFVTMASILLDRLNGPRPYYMRGGEKVLSGNCTVTWLGCWSRSDG